MISFDPSVNNCGVAAYVKDVGFIYRQIKLPDDLGRIAIARVITYEITKFAESQNLLGKVLVCEYPQFFTAQRGKIAATKGYTLDLAFIVGWVACTFSAQGWFIKLYTPNQWKGTMNKEAVGKKFTRMTGIDYQNISDHEYEAVMMLDYYIKQSKKS